MKQLQKRDTFDHSNITTKTYSKTTKNSTGPSPSKLQTPLSLLFAKPKKSACLPDAYDLNPFLRKNINRSILQTAKKRAVRQERQLSANSTELASYLQIIPKETFAFVATFSATPSTQKKKVYINVTRPCTSINGRKKRKGIQFMQYIKSSKIANNSKDSAEEYYAIDSSNSIIHKTNQNPEKKCSSNFKEQMAKIYGNNGNYVSFSCRLHGAKVRFVNSLSNAVRSKGKGKSPVISPEKLLTQPFTPLLGKNNGLDISIGQEEWALHKSWLHRVKAE